MLQRSDAELLLRRLGGKWTQHVLMLLGAGEHRFSQLRRALPSVSEKMLTQTLRDLERDGLVQRTSYPVVPPHVVYRLTEPGERCVAHVAPLVAWLESHVTQLTH